MAQDKVKLAWVNLDIDPLAPEIVRDAQLVVAGRFAERCVCRGLHTCGLLEVMDALSLLETTPQEGFKVCSGCSNSLPLDCFGVGRGVCDECRRKQEAVRYQTKKTS